MTKTALDKIENLEGALVQHGRLSNRIYLMKLGDADPRRLIEKMLELAKRQGYTKLFAKVPRSDAKPFEESGFDVEAVIPKMYDGKEDALLLGFYLDEARKKENTPERLEEIVNISLSKKGRGASKPLDTGLTIRKCTEEDVEQMAKVYAEVFDTYPFPIDTPDYLLETMASHVVYFGVVKDGRLVALSSAEMDKDGKNVEMTDFATLPSMRGSGLAVHLLETMEDFVVDMGIKTSYTIARAISPGMNITFAKMGYDYGGRLINNTNISGDIESMNVWYKSLDSAN